MKAYTIRYDRRVSEEIQIPADIVREVLTLNGALSIIHKDKSTLLVIPTRDLTFCAMVDVPKPVAPASELTDEDLKATEDEAA